jgi:hypothetical protein
MTAITIAQPSKLPLFRTVGQAYALWARNFSDLIRICWLWMLLMVPILAIWDWWQAAQAAEILQGIHAGQPFADPHPVLTWGSVLVSKLIMLPAVASVAVAWHRLLLRDEHPGTGFYLRLDRIVAGYAILAFLIGLIITLPSTAIMVLPQIMTAGGGVTAVVIFQLLVNVAMIVAIFIVPRLSLVLPGIALGRDDATLATAWRLSKRNTWRMVWASFFCLLPLIAISGGISSWLLLSSPDRAVVTLVSLVIGLLWIPGGMISVGMLSLAYRHFFEQRATSLDTLPPPLLPSPPRRRRYGWWVATGIVAALAALVIGGWVLYAEPVKFIVGWVFTGNPSLPGCRTTVVSKATTGKLWHRTTDMSCPDHTIHLVFVKRSDVSIPMLAFGSVDGPVPTSVRETGENQFEIILATPLADGGTTVPFELNQNGVIMDLQIFDHGRPVPVSDKTDIPDLFRSLGGGHQDSR